MGEEQRRERIMSAAVARAAAAASQLPTLDSRPRVQKRKLWFPRPHASILSFPFLSSHLDSSLVLRVSCAGSRTAVVRQWCPVPSPRSRALLSLLLARAVAYRSGSHGGGWRDLPLLCVKHYYLVYRNHQILANHMGSNAHVPSRNPLL